VLQVTGNTVRMTDASVEDTTTTTTTATTSTWNMRDEIAANIRMGVDSLCSTNDATTEDILRIYVDQISNMFITEQVRSALTLDPFQHLKENIPQKCMESIINRISVVSHHSVKTMDGYVRTEAVVSLSHPTDSVLPTTNTKNNTINANNSNSSNNKKRPRTHHSNDINTGIFNLHFTYTRSSMTSIHPCTVSYTIDVCNTPEQAPQPLLWVHVYAAGVVPSSHNTKHAININDSDDDDQWSDINDDDGNDDDDDDDGNEPGVQHVSTNNVHDGAAGSTHSNVNTSNVETTDSQIDKQTERGENDGNEENGKNVDRYEAGMDPDVVSILVSHLSSMPKNLSVKNSDFASYGDITVFFLLMTFPFYEHEWDIVGFLLKAVFDSDDSADGSDEE
jgi:hypothetical protein